MTLKELLEVLQPASIVLAALVAAYGIDAWRREFIGKRKMELAEEVLALSLEAREIISYMRTPGGIEDEIQVRHAMKERQTATEIVKSILRRPLEKQDRHLEKLNRLWALSYRFRAQFGSDAAAPIDTLRGVVAQIKTSTQILLELVEDRDFTRGDGELRSSLRERHEAIVYASFSAGMSEPDKIAVDVDDAIERITTTCRNALASTSTLYGWLNTKVTKE